MQQKENTQEKKQISEENNVPKKNKKFSTKSFLEKNKLIIFGVFFLIIIIVLLFFFMNNYKYSFVLGEVRFVSNEYTPTDFFKEFKTKTRVYVSPVMKENGADPIVFNAMSLWQIALIGNGVEAVQLIRTTNENGNIIYCYTNDGNIYENKQITVQECNSIINDGNNFTVLMDKGNQSAALLTKNKLIVYSPLNVINATNFSVIKQIFPNAEELVRLVNESVYGAF